jgi:hypothetical protein
MKMTSFERQAYDWAIEQKFPSVAARSARALAQLLQREFVKPAEDKKAETDRAFYSGIRTALSILALHDQETIFRELVETCSLPELIEAAKEDGELEFSGLIRYGYAKKEEGESV